MQANATGRPTGSTPDRAFWAGKSVFLTGHTGFKGAWLAAWLGTLGARVTGYALAPDAEPNLHRLMSGGGCAESVIGDIRDQAALDAAMARANPDVVLHLAAQALVRPSYLQPVETLETNVIGTARVLEACRKIDAVRAVVVVTTDKCYENREWHWAYRENEALGGHDPYSASKACAEIVTSAWRRSFLSASAVRPVGLASARAGNVIGGGDWAEDRLLPDCARAFSAGASMGIRNPYSTRPWQHVLEPLSGYLMLAERLWAAPSDFADAWNFGPDSGEAADVASVVRRAAAGWGSGAAYEVIGSDHRHEAGFLAVDSSKARALLGWRPRLDTGSAINWTMDWYRRHYSGEDAAKLVAAQIADYEHLLELRNV